MAALEEFQFELDGYAFGNGLPIFVDPTGFDPGDAEVVDQDQTNPLSGARMMGRDMVGAPTWTWNLHVDGEDPDTALASLAAMAAKWRGGSAGFRDSRTVSRLRYRIGSRTRCVFGRPRRFSAKPDNRILGGYLPPMATFALADAKHYDDDEQLFDMRMAPTVAGGFSFPAAFPITFESSVDNEPPSAVVVEGDAATAPIVTFYGPVLDPKIKIGNFVLGLSGTIYEGGSVTIDARPWAQKITRSGNAGTAGLTRDTRLNRALLEPGAYSAVFTGSDQTGMARCRVRWRNAWHSL